ncbi:major histocompatibility complex class I-related gene protein-like [Emys orbicularis]|uniref:major histocompatibility complex class I-related gene protein-like n=1 Tax=Emys orbicularis TaxID=82168 RepID=UPI0031FCF94E
MALPLALGLCWGALAAAAAEPHSLDILITGLNELDGTHRFFMLAKLDGLALASYSSDTREVKPLREWAAQAVGASYLRKKTQEFRLYEAISRVVTHRWMVQHNQTGGIHTLQLHVNCVLDGDTPVRGQFHFAFDGQDFLILERNQSAWVPLAPGASNETHFWNAGHTWTLFAKEFLQEECVDTLRSLLRGGMEALGRQVPPGISVTYRDAPHGSATLSCHARGFYPRPIRVSWVRDGAEILPPMNASGILPHADGTYQIRQSLEIPPRWGHGYACRVNHSSLGEPVPTTAPGKMGGLAPGILAFLGLAALTGAGAALAGVVVWRRKRPDSGRSSFAPTARSALGIIGAGLRPLLCRGSDPMIAVIPFGLGICDSMNPPPTAPVSPDPAGQRRTTPV